MEILQQSWSGENCLGGEMAVYGPDLELANRLRYWLDPIGVRVIEIAEWQTRGRTYATFDPYGSVNHHTAGGRTGVAPSLGICINGRARLPGPLCNVHQQRDDVVNVVAAGVANHAGAGGWKGLSGNQKVFGLEVEHCGYQDEPFSERRMDISLRVHAAFLSGLTRADPEYTCQHFEWGAVQGKIDFCRPLLRGGPEGFRYQIAQLLHKGPGNKPAPAPSEEIDMTPGQCRDKEGHKWFFIVGTDNDCWASIDGGPFFPLVPRTDGKQRTAFISGLDAMCEESGQIVVAGKGMDSKLYQVVFTPWKTPSDVWIGPVSSEPHAVK